MPVKKKIKKIVKRKAVAKNVTHIRIVLDQSGSMNSVRQITVNGFNEQVATIKANKDKSKTSVGLTLFNHNITKPLVNVPADQLEPLKLEDYQPNGNTDMRGAIMQTIDELETLKDTPETSYLVIVLTDGQHNHGKVTAEELSTRVNKLTDTGRWTFTLLGTNISLTDVAKDTGILLSNMKAYTPTAAGAGAAWTSNVIGTARYLDARSRGIEATLDFYEPDQALDATLVTTPKK